VSGVGIDNHLKAADGVKPGVVSTRSTFSARCLITPPAADELGIKTLSYTSPTRHALPYSDNHFDAAYLVTVLGEIPDQDAALRELRPGGLQQDEEDLAVKTC
jgi:hypothetical protein